MLATPVIEGWFFGYATYPGRKYNQGQTNCAKIGKKHDEKEKNP